MPRQSRDHLESEEQSDYEEGCLSIPEIFDMVTRPKEIDLRYLDRDGNPQEISSAGVLATCVQHEIDHLNGVLFIDYLTRLKRDRIVKKSARRRSSRAREPDVAPHLHGDARLRSSDPSDADRCRS